MTDNDRTEISDLGEFGLIEHLTANFELKQAFSLKGIGDDAAVVDHQGRLTVVTTDLLLEHVHFDLMYMPMKHLGYKKCCGQPGDLYAMNAEPKQITVSVALSNRFSVEAMEELYDGIHIACERYGVDLIGGDTSSSVKGLVISVTALGEANEDELVYRDGANPAIFSVSGDLGAAYMGLQLLEREKRIYIENPQIQPDLEGHPYIVGRQLKPEARRDVIELLREKGLKPTSMIDLSDGLSSDLQHICRQSGTGALVYESKLPIHEETYNMALEFHMDPTTAMLNGGEDYELLFTLPADESYKVLEMEGITIIGKITDASEGSDWKQKTETNRKCRPRVESSGVKV